MLYHHLRYLSPPHTVDFDSSPVTTMTSALDIAETLESRGECRISLSGERDISQESVHEGGLVDVIKSLWEAGTLSEDSDSL